MSGLAMFTIYDHPRDYPDAFVARRFTAGAAGIVADPQPWAVSPSLEAVRDALPPGLYCLPREPADDPRIVETWL